jgi:hypothetical protein
MRYCDYFDTILPMPKDDRKRESVQYGFAERVAPDRKIQRAGGDPPQRPVDVSRKSKSG